MRRSTPPFPVMASGGGSGGGGSGSVVVPVEHYEQEHPESRQLKRKHSEERFTVAYHAYQEPGQSIHKLRKDSHLALPEVDTFHGFGQAFHGPSAEFQVIAAASDGNNNHGVHPEQQQLGYIYEVSTGNNIPAIPVPHSQMISQDIPSTSANGIVLTDISSSNWTRTQELLDLDRRTAPTIQTDSHNCFPIASQHHPTHLSGHQHHHHHHHHHPPGGAGHFQPAPFVNNHPKTQELTIVTSTSTSGSVRSAACSRRVAPAGTPETPEDIEDKNLSWLFNFKLEDLPHLSPEAKRKQAPKNGNASSSTSTSGGGHHSNGMCQPPESELDHVAAGGNNGAAAIEEDDLMVAENVTIENSTASAAAAKATKKPPFTYTELIEYALEDKGELTVSGIYQWISDHFPFYKSNDDRWKNSVRHNLSINPHFRKGNKAPQGAGHLWTISSRDSEANFLAWEHKRQRLELFFKMEAANAKNQREPVAPGSPSQDETAAATASLAQYEPHSPSSGGHGSLIEPLEFRHPQPGSSSQHLQQQQQQQQQMYANGQSNQFEVVQHQQQPGDELKRSAGEILNGIRRNVEVQIVHPINSNNFQAYALLDSDYYLADYLNPVSKEEIVQECGLRSAAAVHRNEAAPAADYYITTIDPIELGINMSAGQDEDQILFEDDFNLNYFGNNIMT